MKPGVSNLAKDFLLATKQRYWYGIDRDSSMSESFRLRCQQKKADKFRLWVYPGLRQVGACLSLPGSRLHI